VYLAFRKRADQKLDTQSDEVVALIGDVGGTNVRLTLRRLNLKTRTSIELKPLTKFLSQDIKRIEEAISEFIKV
jgi:glucokinase